MDTLPILLLQTSPASIALCLMAIRYEKLGLVRFRDFRAFFGLDVEEAVVAGERQLFITDTFGLRYADSLEFNERLRIKNPELISVCCDSDVQGMHRGEFERIIDRGKDDWIQQFAWVIRDFQSGKLLRAA